MDLFLFLIYLIIGVIMSLYIFKEYDDIDDNDIESSMLMISMAFVTFFWPIILIGSIIYKIVNYCYGRNKK